MASKRKRRPRPLIKPRSTAKTHVKHAPIEIPLPPGIGRGINVEPDCRAFRMGECVVMVGAIPGGGLHLSISHASRYPTWDEVADARYALLPDRVTMAMLLPPHEEYINNVHDYCFQLHQVAHRPRPIGIVSHRPTLGGATVLRP